MSVKPITIPIRSIGPGSHKEEVEAYTIGVPDTISTYQMPSSTANVSPETALKCRNFFMSVYTEMKMWNRDSGDAGPAFSFENLDLETLRMINEMLGEGEVAIQVKVPEEKFDEIRVQESIFVGVWRVRYFRNGKAIADQLEISALPYCVAEAAYKDCRPSLIPVTIPENAMNSPAILEEIKVAIEKWEPGTPPVTINLSHLPMSPEDNVVIEKALGAGTVHMISKGLGNCHILSTDVRHVWRIQYFNAAPSGRLILNTVSICGIPEEAIASSEDLEDSVYRLKELLEWVTQSWDLPPLPEGL